MAKGRRTRRGGVTWGCMSGGKRRRLTRRNRKTRKY